MASGNDVPERVLNFMTMPLKFDANAASWNQFGDSAMVLYKHLHAVEISYVDGHDKSLPRNDKVRSLEDAS